MATHLGLGQGLRVMKNEITRSGLGSLRKESLVDMIVSLSFAVRAIPGVQKHLEEAHKITIASPAHGGGVEAAMAYLNGVVCQPVPSASAASPEEARLDNPVQANNSDGGIDTVDPTGVTEDSTTTPCGSTNENASAGGASAHNDDRRVGLCRSNWKGIICSDNSCNRVHKEYCLLRSCYPVRDPDCLLWHPRSWTKPNVQGNGQKGIGQPSTKVAKLKSQDKADSALSREIKLLKQEVALYKERSRFEAKKRPLPSRPVTYKDAVVSSLPLRQQPQLRQPPTRYLHPPPSLGSCQPSRSGDCATVLPANVLTAIQIAVEKAFNNRNPH